MTFRRFKSGFGRIMGEEFKRGSVSAVRVSRHIKAKFHYASWFGAGSKLVRA